MLHCDYLSPGRSYVQHGEDKGTVLGRVGDAGDVDKPGLLYLAVCHLIQCLLPCGFHVFVAHAGERASHRGNGGTVHPDRGQGGHDLQRYRAQGGRA